MAPYLIDAVLRAPEGENGVIEGPKHASYTRACEEEDKDGIRKDLKEYFLEHSPEFRRLTALREKGWNSSQGDKHFERQRKNADNARTRTKEVFFRLMMTIGSEIHNATARGLTLPPGESKILDMCMAPGGFLLKALQINPRANAAAFTLPPEIGGHEVILKPDPKVTTRFADVTMLAEDMGVQLVDIAPDHPDVGKFLPRQLKTDETFGLVLCDGQVLRTHSRAEYRESREAHRLTATQLALGLEHLSPGGTVLILLHKFEAWRTVYLIWTFSQFSDHISIVKPTRGHGMRSSFYMVARNIRSRDQEAIHTVEKWKADWKIATFGTEDEYLEHIASSYEVGVQDILRSLGPTLVRWGDEIWNVQADALENAPFIRDAK